VGDHGGFERGGFVLEFPDADRLLDLWPTIQDEQIFIVDIGIACTGTKEIPKRPTRGKRMTDADWAIDFTIGKPEEIRALAVAAMRNGLKLSLKFDRLVRQRGWTLAQAETR
jgi:hypothetical protein